ncbi:hypothetical protein BASA83_011072 [Batrachochytrium salamandrivorans]|nr:hypothetical protein BASA83_011072 [Batrachochytrium salamandrivorans]
MEWNSCKVKHLQALGHPIADAAIAAAHEAHACALIVFTYTGDMAYFVSKRRPNHPIVAITHRMFSTVVLHCSMVCFRCFLQHCREMGIHWTHPCQRKSFICAPG